MDFQHWGQVVSKLKDKHKFKISAIIFLVLIGLVCLISWLHTEAVLHRQERREGPANLKNPKGAAAYPLAVGKPSGRDYLQSCDANSSSPCIPGLLCSPVNSSLSLCLCHLPTIQVYSPSLRKCVSEVGAPCGEDFPCSKNAKCVSYSEKERISGKCVCPTGYVENLSGSCDGAHGTECGSSMECDNIAGLVCIHGKCQCKHFARYSEAERVCQGWVGSKCEESVNSNGDKTSSSSPCVPYASCKQAHPKIPATYCTCNDWYETTEYNTCQCQQSHNRDKSSGICTYVSPYSYL